MSLTAKQVHDALAKRYGQDQVGAKAEEWVIVPEARCAAGWQGNNGSCDLIAICTRERRLDVVGHEVKVSRRDWLKELAQPHKADRFVKHCTQWWLVVPGPYTNIVHKLDELPPGWGLLEVTGRGCKVVQRAVGRIPQPVPHEMWVAWIAAIDRRQRRTTVVNGVRPPTLECLL